MGMPLKWLGVWLVLAQGLAGGVVLAQRELIEPTRTPNEEAPAQLTVTSEPPRLAVELDGEPAGATPLRNHRVAAGKHKLRVGEAEADILLRPGKQALISVFKGEIIDLSRRLEERPPPAPPTADVPAPPTPAPPRAPEAAGDETAGWERFLTGTSPTFVVPPAHR
jgi:hypothetical protein